jgi:cystathionine beta-synthase
VGVLDEADLLLRLGGGAAHFRDTVGAAMSAKPETLPPSASVEELQQVLDRGLVAIITDEAGGFHGLVTRTDLLQSLRQSMGMND